MSSPTLGSSTVPPIVIGITVAPRRRKTGSITLRNIYFMPVVISESFASMRTVPLKSIACPAAV